MAVKKTKTSSQYFVAHKWGKQAIRKADARKKFSLTYKPYVALDFLFEPRLAYRTNLAASAA